MSRRNSPRHFLAPDIARHIPPERDTLQPVAPLVLRNVVKNVNEHTRQRTSPPAFLNVAKCGEVISRKTLKRRIAF